MNKKTARISLFLVLLALFVATLACEQSGEIVPDAEATRRAIPTVTPTQDMQDVVAAKFVEGDDVVFVGKGYLVPIFKKAGDTLVISHAARNDPGVILNVTLFEDEIWYEVKSVAGTGWISEEFLHAPE